MTKRTIKLSFRQATFFEIYDLSRIGINRFARVFPSILYHRDTFLAKSKKRHFCHGFTLITTDKSQDFTLKYQKSSCFYPCTSELKETLSIFRDFAIALITMNKS